jgi:hypothetical protein
MLSLIGVDILFIIDISDIDSFSDDDDDTSDVDIFLICKVDAAFSDVDDVDDNVRICIDCNNNEFNEPIPSLILFFNKIFYRYM